MNVLVVGLESSCTRYIARLVAANLCDANNWDAVDSVEGQGHSVTHRSLPHGPRDNFISGDAWQEYDAVLLACRDYSCSLRSKTGTHQRDPQKAKSEHEHGRTVMQQLLEGDSVHVWCCEAAALLGEPYARHVLGGMGITITHYIEAIDPNAKYLQG